MPEASPSGALRVILWCAAAIALMPFVMLLVMAAFTGPDAFIFVAAFLSRALFSTNLSNQIAAIGFIPQLALFVWGITTAIMGFSRSASTPRVSSVLVAIWAALAVVSQVAIRILIAQGGGDLVSQISLLPYIIFDVVVVAAYWGYMHDSRAANVYFHQRVRVN
jgi:hypothetical protein